MKFGVNEGIASKVGNFILGIVFVAVFIWAACVIIKSSADRERDLDAQSQFQPST